MRVTSSQRPNLRPTSRSTPTRSKPCLACSATDAHSRLPLPQRSIRASTRCLPRNSDWRNASTSAVRFAFLLANKPRHLIGREGANIELVLSLSIPA